MSDNIKLLKSIEKLPQRQDDLRAQLFTVYLVANKIGCYDAADYLNRLFEFI